MKLAVQEKIYMLIENFSTIERYIHSTNHIIEDGTARHDFILDLDSQSSNEKRYLEE